MKDNKENGFFVTKEEQKKKCTCGAVKKARYKYTYNEAFLWGVEKQEQVDVLVLLECKEGKKRMRAIEDACRPFLKDFKYAIIPALGCTPYNFSTNDTVVTYITCKYENIKKNIEKYKPKVIICVGRAIYTLTETKDFRPKHFFIPIEGKYEDYQLDDCWFFSPEFNCKVFPIPGIFQWVDEDGYRIDCYESRFVTDQVKRATDAVKEPKVRLPKIHHEIIEKENVESFISKIIEDKNIKEISIDTESEGLNYFNDRLFSIQICFDRETGYFFLFDKDQISILKKLFDSDKTIIMHNAPHDLKFLICNGVDNAYCSFDTMLAAHSLNEGNPNGLKPLTWLYTYYGGYEEEQKRYMKKYRIKDFTEVPIPILSKYAAYDAIVTLKIYDYFIERFEKEDPDVKYNFYEYVMPSVSMITDVELTGVKIDRKYINEYLENLIKDKKEIEQKVFNIVGYEFNIRSKKQLTEALLKIPEFSPLTDDDGEELRTKDGYLVLNKDALAEYSKMGYKITDYVRKLNHINKEISQLGEEIKLEKDEVVEGGRKIKVLFKEEPLDDDVYEENNILEGFMESVHNNRLHASYKLHGTETGRAAGGLDKSTEQSVQYSRKGSFGINMQNIPTTEEFRKIFIPDTDYVFGTSDYDGMEVCIYSQISGPGALEDIILSGKDMHCYTEHGIIKGLDILELHMFYMRFKEKFNLPLNAKGEINFYLNKLKELSYEELYPLAKGENKDPFVVAMRNKVAKFQNWRYLFGATGYGIAKGLGISNEAGQSMLDSTKEKYPEVDAYMENQKAMAKQKGYVKTLLGRKRRIPELTYIGNGSRKNKYATNKFSNLINATFNAPVQGTSGQTTLIAMTKIWEYFKKKGMKSKVIINVHDELAFLIHKDEVEQVEKIVHEKMLYSYYRPKGGNRVTLSAELVLSDMWWKDGKPWSWWKENPKEWNKLIENINERNKKNE